MRYSFLATYAYMLLLKLENSNTFYDQIRCIESLSSLLYEITGDTGAKRILEEAVKYESEAIVLDNLLMEYYNEIGLGNRVDIDDDVKERVEKLRMALERFKARLINDLEDALGGKIPVSVEV